jgi:hypothetical protein
MFTKTGHHVPQAENKLSQSGSFPKDTNMIDYYDVAAYILKKKGKMCRWKLQKLVYYSQAWSLVWDGAPLFDEPIILESIAEYYSGLDCPAG